MQTTSHARPRPNLRLAPELAILVLAIALRLITLGSRDYWHDEIHDLLKGQRLRQVLLEGEMVSNHPPLFNVLVRLWGTFGDYDNEWYMRTLPMILGVCGVIAIYLLARTLVNRRVALFAALLLAVSPLHIVHSQDFKVYILLPFTGTVAGWLLYLAMRENRSRLWVGYGLMASIACYSDLFAAPLLVSLNAWALVLIAMRRPWRNRLPRLILANVFGALLYLPLLALMLRRAQAIMVDSPTWWVPPPDLAKVYYVYKSAAFGYSDTAPALQLALVLFTVLIAFGGWFVWRSNRAGFALLVAWCALSLLQLYVISHIGNSVFLIRGTIPYLIPLWIFAGAGIAAFNPAAVRWAAAAAMIALLSIPLYQRYTDRYPVLEYPHRPGIHPPLEFRAATNHILENWREGDIVVHTTNATWYPMFWYGLRNMPSYFAAVHGWHIWYFLAANPRNNTQPDLATYLPVHLSEVVDDAQRVWFVFSEWERMWMRGQEGLPANPTQVWRWFDAHAAQTQYTAFGELEVFLYEYNHGDPPPVIARTRDDGITADLVYGEPLSAAATIVRPDNSLVFQPLSERVTDLSVAFAENTSGTVIDLAPVPARRRTFTITNHGGDTAQCRIEVIASSAMFDLASLSEPDPTQDVWEIDGLYHQGPPRLVGNLVAPVPRPVEGIQKASLVGQVTIPNGHFRPLIYLLGPGGDAVSLTVDGHETLATPPMADSERSEWRWVWGEPFQWDNDPAELVLTARRVGDEPFPSTAAYLALVPISAAPGVIEPGARLEQGIVNVSVPAGEVAAFDVGYDRNAVRLDVWVHERQHPPRVFRIFTTVDVEEAAALAPR